MTNEDTDSCFRLLGIGKSLLWNTYHRSIPIRFPFAEFSDCQTALDWLECINLLKKFSRLQRLSFACFCVDVIVAEDESDVDIETLSDTEQSRNIQRQYCDVSSIGALNILINYFHNYALPSIGPDQRLAEPRAVSSLKSRHHVDNTYSSRPRRKTFNWRTIDRVKSRSPPPLRAVSNKRTLKKLNNKRCAEESDVSDFQDEAGDRPELQKRTSHNRNERSRRRAMAVRFATLRNILPTVAGDPKASKMSVLNEAVLHIRRLETKLASNLEQLTALRDKHHALKDACEMQVHWKAASRSRSGRVAARDVRLQAK